MIDKFLLSLALLDGDGDIAGVLTAVFAALAVAVSVAVKAKSKAAARMSIVSSNKENAMLVPGVPYGSFMRSSTNYPQAGGAASSAGRFSAAAGPAGRPRAAARWHGWSWSGRTGQALFVRSPVPWRARASTSKTSPPGRTHAIRFPASLPGIGMPKWRSCSHGGASAAHPSSM